MKFYKNETLKNPTWRLNAADEEINHNKEYRNWETMVIQQVAEHLLH